MVVLIGQVLIRHLFEKNFSIFTISFANQNKNGLEYETVLKAVNKLKKLINPV